MRVLMTGATAGIGLVAAKRMLDAGVQLLAGARRPEAAPPCLAAARVERMDLADLASVSAFCGEVLPLGPFDALVLNAGLQTVTGGRSAQGLELTFAANHLAHQLILQSLLVTLSPGARVVLTSSGTHDPETKSGMPAPNHADARKLARPDTDPQRDPRPGLAGRRAYSASKLCNVMTARELARRTAAGRPDLSIIAFDPGFTPGTGLARDYPGPLNLVFRYVLPVVVRGERASTPENSGRLLDEITRDAAHSRHRGAYMAVRGHQIREASPAALARDDAACGRLWDDSQALIKELGFAA